MMSSQSLQRQVTSRHSLIGAEVRGVKLRLPLDAQTLGWLHSLWMKHLVLIFPDQAISD